MDPNFPPDLAIAPSEPRAPDPAGTDPAPDPAFSPAAQRAAIREFGIAGRVWEAAYALALYARSPPHLEFDPPFRGAAPLRAIELGAGAGSVAAALARTLRPDDALLATDLPAVLPLLRANLAGTPARVAPLPWGAAPAAAAALAALPAPPTHILGSDLVFFPALLAPLLRTLLALTAAADPALVLAYRVRSLAKETPFWAALGTWFAFAPVLVRRAGGGRWARVGARTEGPLFVFAARRRPETRARAVPADDAALLGARGDDTFETLLLMTLDGGGSGDEGADGG